jgi:hypothetical protein
MPLLASNFTSNLLYGTTIVAGGWANVNLTVDAFAFEGDKTFAVKLRKDSTLGQVISTSAPITIKDYTTIVGLSANISTVNEGNLVQFTLTTTNVVNYTNVAYSVFPATANVTADDFVANTGYITIINNVGTFALKANADVSLMDETGENFRVQIRDRNSTNVFISSNITIGDVSRGINVVRFVESAVTTAEGGTLTLTFTATNANNIIIFYSTDGNATSSTFTGGNTGSFILNGTSNTFTLLPTGVPYSTTQNFRVVLRSDSATGPIVTTSNNLIVLDSSIAYMTATGGTIVDDAGYRLHAFATSGNLTISSLGAGPSQNLLDYLVVAGGGGGGGGYQPAGYAGGGGGGAGGLLTANTIVTTTGNSVIVVGAAGVGLKTNAVGGSGSPSTLTIAGSPTLTATGGGGGSGGPLSGRAGGSGGGSAKYLTSGGAGTPGQGYSGGISAPITEGSVGNDYMGGGGGGAGEAGHWNPSDPVDVIATSTLAGGKGLAVPWAPPAYGTTGPAPGRWFAGGGGGGGSPGGVARILSGGAGGGGAGGNYGPGPATSALSLGTLSTPGAFESGANAIINTGGGGGGVGQSGVSSYPPGTSGQGGSGIVLIRYPYSPPITVSNVLTTSNVFAVGANITFTINALNANTLTLYYSTEGNVDASHFIGGNTGSFVANANGNVFTLIGNTNSIVPVGQTRNFRLQIRQDSTTGYISGSSSNVALYNYSDYYVQATGGQATIDSSGYRLHVFTSSANLTVTSAGITGIEYLLVAGGGGGGTGYYGFYGGGGGGGAGGLINTSIALPTTGNIVVTVGGGGTNNSTGANTTLSGIVSANAFGGGGGISASNNGRPGGSGGGGATSLGGSSYGLGTTGQGFRGGLSSPITVGGATNNEMAGGGGGAGEIGHWTSGDPTSAATSTVAGGRGLGISWVPASYGTTGATTGRWFAGGGGGGNSPNGEAAKQHGGAGGGGYGGAYYGANSAQSVGLQRGGQDGGGSATINTGGGGGGVGSAGAGSGTGLPGLGGSGIVIIRYLIA